MKEKKVVFFNKKKQKLVGLLSLPKITKSPIVIIVHGFKGTKEYYPFVNHSIEPFTKSGIAVLRIDCRGSGESDMDFKKMTVKSESDDVLTAIDYVKTLDINPEKIVLIGVSMGADAILMAMRRKPKLGALIFWEPAWYFKGDKYYDTPEHRKIIKEKGVFYVKQGFTGKILIAGKNLFREITSTLDIRPYMKLVKVPVLILRGSKDEVMGSERDEEATRLLKADYKIIEKGDHNFLDRDAEKKLIKLTIGWLKKWL